MTEFWLISGIGHCATKWLTTVLNNQPGITALHEYKMTSTGMDWVKAAKYENRYGVNNKKYQPYFEAIANAQADIVVDANSWSPALLGEVSEIIPITRVIHIVRHGVSQLHSLYTQSSVWANSDSSAFVYKRHAYQIAEIAGYRLDDWSELTNFEKLCWMWRGNSIAPLLLNEQGLLVDTVSFEGLTQREELAILVESIGAEEISRWQHKDINRKVSGSRRPDNLWKLWSVEQREAFKRICSDGMERYGYKIPEG